MGGILYALDVEVLHLSQDQLELQMYTFFKKEIINTSPVLNG